MPIVGQFGSLARAGSFLLPGGAMESIATVTVGSGGASEVVFDNIAGTFQHLQIRGIGRSNRSNTSDPLLVYFNTDTTNTNYTYHNLTGDGANANAYGQAAAAPPQVNNGLAASSATSNAFGVSIIDILDYASTSKNKTRRSFMGVELNTTDGSSVVGVESSLWLSTAAITKITLKPRLGTTIQQHSTFALYGLRAP